MTISVAPMVAVVDGGPSFWLMRTLASTTARTAALSASLLAMLAAAAGMARAQPATGGAEDTPALSWSMGAGAIGLVTRADPAFDGRAYTEAYLTQPMWMGRVRAPHAVGAELVASINLEGLTLRRGELNAGIFGEGYVDRRHPHTLLHEIMVSVGGSLTDRPVARWSVAAGRGFVPFGSDDPMARPFVKFPVNHHFAQILERYVAIAGVGVGPFMVEGAAFNGDEPVGPYEIQSLARFGDSFAARVTLQPTPWLEMSVSGAQLDSPENPDGQGLDQRKSHLGIRAERGEQDSGDWRYAMAEYARTEDRSMGQLAHRYESVLVEGGIGWRAWQLAVRGERSDRPEEQRTLDPFRSPRSHSDGSLLGVTRWGIVTAMVAHRSTLAAGVELRPFAEVAYLHADPRSRPTAFEPAGFYGRDRMWSLSGGLRLWWGMRHPRMGRYGVAVSQRGAVGHGMTHAHGDAGR